MCKVIQMPQKMLYYHETAVKRLEIMYGLTLTIEQPFKDQIINNMITL